MEAGSTGTLNFADGTSAKIKFVAKDTYPSSGMPSDYWLAYAEDETNRQVVHPDFGKSPVIKSEILLPEMLFRMAVVMD